MGALFGMDGRTNNIPAASSWSAAIDQAINRKTVGDAACAGMCQFRF